MDAPSWMLGAVAHSAPPLHSIACKPPVPSVNPGDHIKLKIIECPTRRNLHTLYRIHDVNELCRQIVEELGQTESVSLDLDHG